MVEVMMAMTIVLLLVTIGLVQYGGMNAEAQEHAARADLDVLRGEIRRSQLERRADYDLTVPPRDSAGKDLADPWGHPYVVAPARHRVYSIGQNGRDEGGEGDDVALGYDAYASLELKPPAGFRVAEHGADWLKLVWSPVSYEGGVEGYHIHRRSSVGESEPSTAPINPEIIPRGDAPEWRDVGLEAGQVYYYALEVVAKDGQRARTRSMLGFQIPLEGPPRLAISPGPRVTTDLERNVAFTVTAGGAGAPLSRLTFDRESFDLDAVEKTVTVSRRWAVPGTFTLAAEVVDARGRKTAMDVTVEVRPPPASGP